MHSFRMIFLEALLIAGVLSGLFSSFAVAQNCQCDTTIYCCSQYGYCGNSYDYCGPGCQAGPCWVPCKGDGTLKVSEIVTQKFWDGIASQAATDCPGKGFYTRSAFIEAISAYPDFGTKCTDEDRKREIAAYFAHVTHETGHLCSINEKNGHDNNYCQASQAYPCNPNKEYFGRGPLQLSWNYNYIDAGKELHFDGLNDPDIVGRDAIISFKTSLWFWMKKGVHYVILDKDKGFGASIRIINGGYECDGHNTDKMLARVAYYKVYCSQLGVSSGPDNHNTCVTSNLAVSK